jgi:hypothetical protein
MLQCALMWCLPAAREGTRKGTAPGRRDRGVVGGDGRCAAVGQEHRQLAGELGLGLAAKHACLRRDRIEEHRTLLPRFALQLTGLTKKGASPEVVKSEIRVGVRVNDDQGMFSTIISQTSWPWPCSMALALYTAIPTTASGETRGDGGVTSSIGFTFTSNTAGPGCASQA